MSFKNEISLSDLALLQMVAEAGTLTAASQRSGIPVPTLSRRMRALEDRSERRLFLRGSAGMVLTEDWRALIAEIAPLAEVRGRVARWQHATDRQPVVRITAGALTAMHLARHLTSDRAWQPAFVPTHTTLDLARREADIGIRNRPEDHPWLARRKLRRVRYYIYGTTDALRGFVGATTAETPSQHWVETHHEGEIVVTASSARIALDLAQTGQARIVLPDFIGDRDSALIRLSDEIADLAHDPWLVSHQDARHDPPIRAALDWIAEVLG